MPNERKTESLVRAELKAGGYYSGSTIVEEQQSAIAEVAKLLRSASKSGKGGSGSPEFIISNPENPDFVAVIECKANPSRHASPNLDHPVDFAVDGALHYARRLRKSYNVIAIGASGETRSQFRLATYLHPKQEENAAMLETRAGVPLEEIVPWNDLIEHATFDPTIQRLRHDELMAFSRELHDFMRDHAKLTESEKPLLVSGTLIALQNKAFAKSFDAYSPQELQGQWLQVIADEIGKATLPRANKTNMTQPYSTIAVHPELEKISKKFPKGVLFELIKSLNEKVWPFISVYSDFDVVGQFYGEFLKYTGGDKKALGIVLTPRHITDLFARLANVDKDSTVLDICAGTGGFLVSSMHSMMQSAVTSAERERIKNEGLVGIENQPNMYALAASNMILRGDGKANLHQGSCFDQAIVKAIGRHKCDVGMLNPPYSQKDSNLQELAFVKQMLNCLEPNGIGIAIVPISCAISPSGFRRELMATHTLEAVMSMPQELFYPVGVVTCIMVWRAGAPHKTSGRKTWFGYWREDGFIKTKHKGRIDLNGRWQDIKDRWVEMYRNREVHAGISVMAPVDEDSEWCAEAYMDTDYSTITEEDFQRELKQYAIYRIQSGDEI